MTCTDTGKPPTVPMGMATAGCPVVLAGMVSAPLLPSQFGQPETVTAAGLDESWGWVGP
jgi:hypothetical protein